MKHLDKRQKCNLKLQATQSCKQLKVAYTCIIVYMYSRTHVSLYTSIHVFAHTCIIVYNDTRIPGSMHTVQAKSDSARARRTLYV